MKCWSIISRAPCVLMGFMSISCLIASRFNFRGMGTEVCAVGHERLSKRGGAYHQWIPLRRTHYQFRSITSVSTFDRYTQAVDSRLHEPNTESRSEGSEESGDVREGLNRWMTRPELGKLIGTEEQYRSMTATRETTRHGLGCQIQHPITGPGKCYKSQSVEEYPRIPRIKNDIDETEKAKRRRRRQELNQLLRSNLHARNAVKTEQHMLLLLLVPLHVQRSQRSHRNEKLSQERALTGPVFGVILALRRRLKG